MSSTENSIRERLIRLINTLVELALRAMGLWGDGAPDRISVTVIWEVELWWERTLPLVIDETRIGPEAAERLRTALGALAERLETAVAQGAGPDEIRQQVLAFRDQWVGWARRVAATESTRLASEAVLASPAATEAGAAKQWVTSHDERVRGSHRRADGQTVAISGNFIVGNAMLAYPGDPYGDLEEIVGCRCGLRIVNRREGR